MTDSPIFEQQLTNFSRGLVGDADTLSDTERRNAESLRLLYQKFNENDLDAVVELVTEDYELVDMASGETTRSREAFRQRLKIGKAALPDASAEVTRMYADGSVVIAEVVNRGTHLGTFRLPGGDEIPPTGRTMEARGCEIYEFREEKVARGRLYYDRLTLAEQLRADQVDPKEKLREIERRNAETLRLLYEKFNEKDTEYAAQLAADDFELEDIASRQIIQGPEGFADRLAADAAAFSDSRVEITRMFTRGDSVIVETVTRGTHTGSLRLPGGEEVPATGRKIEVSGVAVYEVRDGKIARGRQYHDILTFSNQLGLKVGPV